ncbi:phage tail protein [Flavobacterium jejuense]|uniref:Phage tail protein n=1 Tax=Flavobacterium jejuense TaxID=1544455 RepID=A0ABX0J2D2_9FLAO|nr:type VI secretion system tube protein TssD [Flavobacterium jejuense]NHN28050.1 phage tail protein [Flavobacterium jejuense]
MSFKSKVTLGGKEYNILKFSYELFQEIDATGRPSSVTRGGTLNFTVESTGDTNLAELAMDNFERKDGKVTFVKRDTDAKLKELNFSEAYLIRYKEEFDATGTNPLVETFTLSAEEIAIGGAEHKNSWV